MQGLDTRGILDPNAGGGRFHLSRLPPPDDLAAFVEWHWVVCWDLRGREPYEAQTLPFPSVNMVVQEGRSAVHGVMTRRFTRLLEGRGFADRAAKGARVDWAALAQDLGYFDQAHFSKDFKMQVGRSPAQYAAFCAGTLAERAAS